MLIRSCLLVLMGWLLTTPAGAAEDSTLAFHLRYQEETQPRSGRYHTLTRPESWKPAETAVIVCDVWDLHHCLNAVRREEEFAPRLNEVLVKLREQGVTVIHAPSDCMAAYADHPGRKRAQETPKAAKLPAEIGSWCYRIPAEERGFYPIDQSDGGEDDDPQEHAEWAAKLAAMGRNPKAPWKSQSSLITIDADRDYISDQGDEVWSILERGGIRNVILTGVHTNMCVLGRPFGLRQMSKNGKNVVLMRDMTDTMYNPQRAPFVSHFSGTDLIISHVERFVSPTITSDQVLGGQPFRFKNDRRPHVAIVVSEPEYETQHTVPEFAEKHLRKDYRLSYIFGSQADGNDLPGLEAVPEADGLFLSVRRRLLKPEQLEIFRRYVSSGKPVVGIRTASHAFCLRGAPLPEGRADWPEFDAQVFGGNYSNHYGNNLRTTVQVASGMESHGIVDGVRHEPFASGGSLYVVSPLMPNTSVLMTGRVEGKPDEPVAWTFTRQDGGKSFYTSLGHKQDFENPDFQRLLKNAVSWAVAGE